MEVNDSIPIRNIYYMLAYAYKSLSLSEYKRINNEKFDNVISLYTEILLIGLPVLIRSGLLKDYIRINDRMVGIRGKIDINSSIKKNTFIDKKLIVIYDDFSEDIVLNQILKATVLYLSKSSKLKKEKRKKFFSYLPYFDKVSDVELDLSLWKEIQYNRQNIRYQFLVDICRFLYQELLISEEGDTNTHSLKDGQRLSSLYEKFVYEFYKRETSFKVTRPQIPWKVNDGFDDALPIMQTDIVLEHMDKTLIIDTKFYTENMIKRFKGGNSKQISANLYQIFTYINNWVPRNNEVVSGMLIYAGTTADDQPEHHYIINGNSISVVTINLNQEFKEIHNNLISLANEILN